MLLLLALVSSTAGTIASSHLLSPQDWRPPFNAAALHVLTSAPWLDVSEARRSHLHSSWISVLIAARIGPLFVTGAAPIPDPQRSLVYGGGLNPRVIAPARYFYIQAVDKDGNNITESLGRACAEIDLVSMR